MLDPLDFKRAVAGRPDFLRADTGKIHRIIEFGFMNWGDCAHNMNGTVE